MTSHEIIGIHMIKSSLLALTLLLFASSASAQLLQSTHNNCDTAVFVKATTEHTGIQEEHQWIETHYPHATWDRQRLIQCPRTIADKIEFTTVTGNQEVVYFDISGFFGKLD